MNAERILVVEDESIIALHLEETLSDLGYRVAGSLRTGEEAIQHAGELAPDLILMDIHLAGAIDGIRAADVIRERVDVPIVFLTAHSDAGMIDRAKRGSPYGYLVKPVSARELAAAIEIALERHRSDRRTRESEQFVRTILQTAHDGFWVTDAEGRIVTVNDSYCRMTGWSREELIGKSGAELEVSNAAEKRAETIAWLMKKGSGRFEGHHRRRDGSVVDLEISATWMPEQRMFCGFLRDITESLRLDRMLAREIQIDVLVSDVAGRLLVASDLEVAAELILDSARRLTGARWSWFLMRDEASGRLVCPAACPELNGRSAGSAEALAACRACLLDSPPGSKRAARGLTAAVLPWIPAEDRPVRNLFAVSVDSGKGAVDLLVFAGGTEPPDGSSLRGTERLAGLLALAMERLRVERELLDRRIEVEQARARERQALLLEGLAHEVRNPLHGLQVSAEALRADIGDSGESSQLVGHIEAYVHRLGGLMRSLLELTHPPRSDEFRKCRPDDLLQALLVEVDERIPERAGLLEVVGCPQVSSLSVIPAKIVELLLQIVLNAFQVSPPGSGVRLDVTVEREELVFRVVDRGRGLPAELGERIFEPLVTSEIQRRGIGLALARHYAELHGGSIAARDNEPGPGATFTLRLPLHSPGEAVSSG